MSADRQVQSKVDESNCKTQGDQNVNNQRPQGDNTDDKLEQARKEEDTHREEQEAMSKKAVLEVPAGSVAYSGNPQQFLERKETDPQIIIPTDVWSFQPINPGILIPPFLGDPAEYEKIKPPAVVKTIEARVSELTEEEQAAFKELRAHCESKGYSGPQVDDWALIRYGIARHWKVKKSADMIDATMQWRSEHTPENSLCQRCRLRPSGHCMTFIGWDLQHRPVMYMSHKWGLERGSLKDDIAHTTESYDHLVSKMPTGVTQWVAMVDFVTYSHWRDGSPSTGKQVGGLLQNHYPERLALQVLIDPPTSFWLLWKLISPFIDPKTKGKICFWYSDQDPNIATEFPKLFPPHLCDWLLTTYANNAKKVKKVKS